MNAAGFNVKKINLPMPIMLHMSMRPHINTVLLLLKDTTSISTRTKLLINSPPTRLHVMKMSFKSSGYLYSQNHSE